MSNKLAKAARPETNGHAPGRSLPSFRTPTGYTLRYRVLSSETLPRLQAAAKTALASERPHIPTQKIKVGPNDWRDEPNPHDEHYQEALEAWEQKVEQDAGMRFLKLCEEYALIYEVDTEEVRALKAAYAAVGDETVADLSDRQIFLWWIALPAPEDQLTLYSKLFGGLTEEAIQAQKQTFLSQLQRGATAPSA